MNNVRTVYCANHKCLAYKQPVPTIIIGFRRSKNCEVCGLPMNDGARFAANKATGKKTGFGKSVRGLKVPEGSGLKKKATKRTTAKRTYKR